MSLKYYFSRILHDRLKLITMLVLFVLPILEVGQIAWSVHQGFSMPVPHYATFLSLFTLRHHLHKIMFWFLPLFLLIITSEDTIEDFEKGYHNVLQARRGKKEYILSKIQGSFMLSFLIVFLALIVNMALVYLFFRNGDFQRDDWQGVDYTDRDLTRISIPHPVLTNLCYIVIVSILAGLIGTVGTALALVMRNRKTAYGLTFLLWFVPVSFESSLMYVIQPFIYVNFEAVIPTLLTVVIGYLAVIILTIIVEVRGESI